jgi:hypothetical protein
MRSNLIIAAGLLLFVAILLTGPKSAQLSAEADLVTDHGIVTEIYENSFKDFVVRLHGQTKAYYMDVSGAKGISLKELQSRLLHQPVTIRYPERSWSGETGAATQYISSLESGGEIVFAEE